MVVFKVYYGHSFFYCFHSLSFLKDMFREFGFAFCVSEIFPMFFKSCPNVHGAMGCDQKSCIILLVWRWHQLLSEFQHNGRFSRVSRRLGREIFTLPSCIWHSLQQLGLAHLVKSLDAIRFAPTRTPYNINKPISSRGKWRYVYIYP